MRALFAVNSAARSFGFDTVPAECVAAACNCCVSDKTRSVPTVIIMVIELAMSARIGLP